MAAPKTEPKIFTGIGLDFETGDLDCLEGAITQLSMQGIRLDNLELISSYNKYITPYNKQNIGSPKRKVLRSKHEQNQPTEQMVYKAEALKYSGITMDKLIKQGVDIMEVGNDVISFAKDCTLSNGKNTKPVLIGQNITFDVGFLQQLMNYTGLVKEFEKVFAGKKDFYGNFQPHYIDTIDLARFIFANDPTVTSYKLEMIAELLGLELDDAHDADADVTATLNIMRISVNRLRIGDTQEGNIIHKREKTRSYFKI